MTIMTENTKIQLVKSKRQKPVSDFFNKIYLIRGLPGSGKTTVANDINPVINDPNFIFRAATDDWFVDSDGKYKFNPSDLVVNHAACLDWFKDRVGKALGGNTIIIHNTFTMYWELHPYINHMKGKENFRITVLDVFDGGLTDAELAERNTHGVGKASIERMRDRWVPWSLKDYYH